MLHDSCIINGHVPLDLSGNFEAFFPGGVAIFPNYLMPENNHRNDWILDLFGGPNEAGKCEMKVSLFRPESQKLTESWFVFIPFRYRSNDVSKKSRGLVGRGLGWRQVGSIPPISNFIPLPSHQEVYCYSAKMSMRCTYMVNRTVFTHVLHIYGKISSRCTFMVNKTFHTGVAYLW